MHKRRRKIVTVGYMFRDGRELQLRTMNAKPGTVIWLEYDKLAEFFGNDIGVCNMDFTVEDGIEFVESGVVTREIRHRAGLMDVFEWIDFLCTVEGYCVCAKIDDWGKEDGILIPAV